MKQYIFIILFLMMLIGSASASLGYNYLYDAYINSTSTLTDYQVKFILSNETHGQCDGSTLYTNGTTRSDWADIEFTDTSNTSLSFWKENNTESATNSTWWVRIPSIANNNTTRVRVHYGNASDSTSKSNGDNTFVFFDDFDGAAVDTAKWTVVGSPTVANGWVNASKNNELQGKASYSNSYSMRTRVVYQPGSESGMGGFFTTSNTRSYAYNLYGNYPTGGVVNALLNGATGFTMGSDGSTPHVYDILRSGTQAQMLSDGNSKGTLTSGSSAALYIQLCGDSGTTGLAKIVTDWIAIRNYSTSDASVNVCPGTSCSIPPVTSFTGSPLYGQSPLQITFTDSSTNSPTNWDWYFGNGTKFSDSQNPTTTLTTGTHSINLYTSNAGGGDWENKTNYITVIAPFNNLNYGNYTDFIVNSTSSLTNYQVKMIVSNATGSASTTIFYTNGTTRSDWSDVAFTNTSNYTLSFWKENRTDTSVNSTWWVKVPSIANDNTTKIRMFYGNASQTISYSDANSTFEFYDDFDGAAVDTAKWSVSGTNTVASSEVLISTTAWEGITSIPTFSYNTASRTYARISSTNGAQAYIGYHTTLASDRLMFRENSGSLIGDNRASASESTVGFASALSNSYHMYESQRNSTSDAHYVYDNGAETKTLATNLYTGAMPIRFGEMVGSGTNFYIDWTAVRKYTANEPFMTCNSSTAGAGETPVPIAKFAMNSEGVTPPSGTLVADAGNPTMSEAAFDTNLEHSMIQDPNNATIVDNWYRMWTGSVDSIWYTNATNALGDNWGTPIKITDIPDGYNLPTVIYDIQTSKYYMFVSDGGGTGARHFYLYNSTNKLNWSIMNGGTPVLVHGATASTYSIFNVGVAPVNSSYWAMLIEGNTNGGAYFLESYSYSNLAEMNWTAHVSTNAVIDPGAPMGAGNPDLKYVYERNALLAITGYSSTGTWKIGTVYASLADNPALAASWHNNGDLITQTSIHIADPSVMFPTGKTHAGHIIYNYDQTDGRQQFFDMNLVQWYDYLKGSDPYLNQILTGYAPLEVNFTDLSTNTPTAWNYSFRNVTGNNTEVWFSQTKNTSLVFNGGNFSIKLTATNAGGSNTTPYFNFVNVSVIQAISAPVASFSVADTFVRIPNTITVTDTSTNTPTSWAWSWGDGTANSTTQNPTHQYTKRGKFTINMAATNAGGTGVATAQTVRVVGYENVWY